MNLLENAEARRVRTLHALDSDSQATRGQFFTPLLAARIIASLPNLPESGVFTILDPGAGSGILTAAIADRIHRLRPKLKMEITAIENDIFLHPALNETLQEIERFTTAKTTLIPDSFLNWALSTTDRFDLVIQNPPYAKLSSKSEEQALLRSNGIVVPNIYAAFMALALRVLRESGQQVAITPRSWMNGSYYATFRHQVTRIAGINAIHTFESRSKVFKDTGVLQEAVIVSMTKGSFPEQVDVYTSHDHLSAPSVRTVAYADVVTPDFVHIPATELDTEAVAWMTRNVSCLLSDLGLTVSTGRVVDFRSRENLRVEHEQGAVPLLHASHLHGGHVQHPIRPKKPEWFVPDSEKTKNMLVDSGAYVLIKRFSAKEERRRVVAGIWESDEHAAFDNKLNFIHCNGGGIDPRIARGLWIFLNSTQLDRYFRVFSGHTQVNATDLRHMRFPTESQLLELGSAEVDGQERIDAVVENIVVQETVAA